VTAAAAALHRTAGPMRRVRVLALIVVLLGLALGGCYVVPAPPPDPWGVPPPPPAVLTSFPCQWTYGHGWYGWGWYATGC